MSNNDLLYLMIINGNRQWLPLYEAGVVYDFGFAPVEIGGQVMGPGGKERDITEEEKRKIAEIADEYSASK